MQRDITDKECKRLDSTFDRLRLNPTDTGNIRSVLDHQRKTAEGTRDRANQRLNDTDARLENAVGIFLEKLLSAVSRRASQIADVDGGLDAPTMVVSPITETRGVEETLKKRLAKETLKLEELLKSHYESRLCDLTSSLKQERIRTDTLEKTIAALTERFDEMDNRNKEKAESAMMQERATNAMLEQKLDILTRRVDKMDSKSKEESDGVAMRERTRNDMLDSKLEILTAKLDKMEDRISEHAKSTTTDESARIATLDSKLETLTATLDKMDDRISENAQSTTTQVSARNDILESKLEAMTGKLEKMDNKINENAESTTTHKCVENDLLKSNLAALSERLEELRNAHKERSETFTIKGASSLEQLQRLSTRIESVEKPISQLWPKLDEVCALTKDNTANQQAASAAIAGLQSAITKLSREKPKESNQDSPKPNAHSSSGMAVENSSQSSLSEAKVLEIIQPLLGAAQTKLKTSVQTSLQKFAPFIDKERDAREVLAKRIEEISGQILAFPKGVEALSSKVDDSVSQLGDQSREHAKELAFHGQRIMSLVTHFDGIKRDTTSSLDSFQHQLANMTAWQNNFDTRNLYRDIVKHINATLPETTSKQLGPLSENVRALGDRIKAVEDRDRLRIHNVTGDGGPVKRRKLPNGETMSVKGQ